MGANPLVNQALFGGKSGKNNMKKMVKAKIQQDLLTGNQNGGILAANMSDQPLTGLQRLQAHAVNPMGMVDPYNPMNPLNHLNPLNPIVAYQALEANEQQGKPDDDAPAEPKVAKKEETPTAKPVAEPAKPAAKPAPTPAPAAAKPAEKTDE